MAQGRGRLGGNVYRKSPKKKKGKLNSFYEKKTPRSKGEEFSRGCATRGLAKTRRAKIFVTRVPREGGGGELFFLPRRFSKKVEINRKEPLRVSQRK